LKVEVLKDEPVLRWESSRNAYERTDSLSLTHSPSEVSNKKSASQSPTFTLRWGGENHIARHLCLVL